MEPPINVFWDFLKNLKDLVVSVKIESAKACHNGNVLAQLSNSEFKVEDKEGNVGICKLVEKQTGQKIKVDAEFTKGLDMSGVVTKFLNQVKFDKPKDKTEVKNLFTRLFIDRLHPLYRMVQRVEDVKNTSGKLNIYEQFRVLVGMTNRAGSIINRGMLRAKDLEIIGKSFNDAMYKTIDGSYCKIGIIVKNQT